MSHRRTLRPAAIAAGPVLILVLGTLFACRDTTQPHEDQWAGDAMVSLQVQADLRAFDAGGVTPVRTSMRRIDVPVLHAPSTTFALSAARSGQSIGHRTVIRHRRDSSGRLQSLALYYATPNAPPTILYAFEDGHIRAIDARTYRRQGSGFARTRSRVTVFDQSGRPVAQLDMTPNGATVGQKRARTDIWPGSALAAVKDVASVLLPAPLHADDLPGSCVTEFLAWTAASGAVALATSALSAAVAACPATAGVTCALAVEAGVKLVAAIAAWSYAMDKYLECRDRPNVVTTGGGGGGTIRPEDSYADDSYEEETVLGFVNKAIDSGNYWCSSDGTDCVYYAAE